MAGLNYRAYDFVDYPIFVLEADAEGLPYYAYLNPVGCNLLGKRPDEVVGMRADQLFSGRVAQSIFLRQYEAWAAGKACTYDIVRPTTQGDFWYRTRLTPIRDASGHLQCFVGASQDVTREIRLEQSEALTSAALSEMEDFVSFAAHDLRSPLGNVKSIVEILRENFVDHGDGKLELLDVLDTLADQTLHVVTDVIAQAMSARVGSEAQDFDLQTLCEDILVQLDPVRRHEAHVQQARLNADYMAIQIVLRNLIDNAFKHADQSRVTLAIKVASCDAEQLQISVCDDGAGFSDPDLVFLDQGGMSAESGFGLIGVRRLVRSRGGRIEAVRPSSGRGAEIHVTLPGRLIETTSRTLKSSA